MKNKLNSTAETKSLNVEVNSKKVDKIDFDIEHQNLK
jgi:hypothetical protein